MRKGELSPCTGRIVLKGFWYQLWVSIRHHLSLMNRAALHRVLDGTGDSLLAAALLELSRICRVSSVTFEVSLRGMEIGSGWMTLALFGGSRTSSSLLSLDIRILVEGEP